MQKVAGKHVKLRALEKSDIDFLYSCENDPDVWKVSSVKTPVSRELLVNYVEEIAQHDIFSSKQLRLMVEVENGVKVGSIELFDFDPFHRRAGLGILIHKDFRGKGYAKDAVRTIIQYCFEVLVLKQLYCNVLETNVESLGLFESLGFKKVGNKQDWILSSEGWQNECLFQLLNHSMKA